jgi:type II secretory pathway predicted ATPase ExeA
MYEEFYGLTRRPFSKTPDPAFLYEGAQHGEALARLEMAAAEKEIALLTGEIGAGKTTLSRALIDKLDARYRVVLLMNPRMSAQQVLQTVAERLEVKSLSRNKTKLLDALCGRLYELYEQGAVPLLIVEEAHLIPSKNVFEELRLLTNLQLDDAALLGLILIGQPELREKLARKDYQSFLQRVGIAYHLRPLEDHETAAYIEHRLRIAGRSEMLFTADAVKAIHAGSAGIPRRINTLCNGALLVGFGAAQDVIDRAVVDDVWSDLSTHLGGVFERPSPAQKSSEARR